MLKSLRIGLLATLGLFTFVSGGVLQSTFAAKQSKDSTTRSVSNKTENSGANNPNSSKSVNKNFDAKIYKILIRELKAGEKLQNSNPNAKNLFRVFTTRTEILKLLKGKNVQDQLASPNSSKAKSDEYKIKEFYNKTKQLGDKLENGPNFPEKAKFQFIYGLTIYEFEEKNDKAVRLLISSYKNVQEKELKLISASKIADYYFNMGNYKESVKYYYEANQLDPNSDWKYRHLHNLAWSYFKLEEYSKAINALMVLYNRARKENETKDYYYQQAVNKLPAFHLYNNKPEKGFEFILSNSDFASKEIEDYLKLAYDKGFFEKIDPMVQAVEKNLTEKKKFPELLNFRLSIYGHISTQEFKKNYGMLSRLRSSIAADSSRGMMTAAVKKQFIDENKVLLNDYLKQINGKDFDPKTNPDDKLVGDESADILKMLMVIDPKNGASYRLRLAQLYRSSKNNELALNMMWEDYEKFGATKNPEAEAYLIELLAVAGKLKEKPKQFQLERLYTDYLTIGKNKEIRSLVYLKYFDEKYNANDMQTCLEILKKYKKEFPEKSNDRQKMLTKIYAKSIESKDKKLFEQVRNYANSDPGIKDDKELSRAINLGHNSFVLEKLNSSLSEGKNASNVSSAFKLAEIFRSNAIDRPNQLISGFNAGLIFANSKQYGESKKVLDELLTTANPKEYGQYQDRIAGIASKMSNEGQDKNAAELYLKMYKTNCTSNPGKDFKYARWLIEYFLSEKNIISYQDMVESSKACKWDGKLISEVLALSVDYIDWRDRDYTAAILRTLLKNEIINKDDIQRLFELSLGEELNSQKILSINSAEKSIDGHQTKWFSPFNFQEGQLIRESRYFFQVVRNLRQYERKKINAANFSIFVEKSLEVLTTNLDSLAKIQPKTNTVAKFIRMVEIDQLRKFFDFYSKVDTLIEDQKNKATYMEQIQQVIAPFREKLVTFEDKYRQFNKKEGSLIKHYTFDDNDFVQTSNFPIIVADRI